MLPIQRLDKAELKLLGSCPHHLIDQIKVCACSWFSVCQQVQVLD